MIRFFSKLLLFLLILASIKGMLVYVSDSLNPLTDTLTGKICLLNSLRPPVNTLFIGSSRTYTALNPAYFDSLTQQTHAVNLGISNLFMPYTADLCEEALSRPAAGIRYILFELSLPTTRLDPFQGKPLRDVRFYRDYESAVLSQRAAKTDSILNAHINEQVFYTLSPSKHLFLNKLFSFKAKLPGLIRQHFGALLPPDKLHYLPDPTPPKPKPDINGYLSSTQQLTEKSAALSATHLRGMKVYQDKSLPMDMAYSFYLLYPAFFTF